MVPIGYYHAFSSVIATSHNLSMMTSSNANIFRVTGPLCGEFTGPGEFPTPRPVTRSFDVFVDQRLNKRLSELVNNREAGDLRRHRGHYDVIVMDHRQLGCLHFITLTTKKTSKLCITALCDRLWLVDSPKLRPVMRKVFHVIPSLWSASWPIKGRAYSWAACTLRWDMHGRTPLSPFQGKYVHWVPGANMV